ncbi:alpha/beta hydrolase fold domain-containing protein [Williamsia soli]|uniref:alpha/beta hydrolase fold domain-containing protein n=1 Tax=Williamsia soli TaxID=364929 RepID=UPI001A9F39FB|nr:alpha/beta hydrolase fold domain-containing protein [Williamsia soli]
MTENNFAAADLGEGTQIAALDSESVRILRIVPAGARSDTALLHFHGGGYRKGSPEIFADSLARIAEACRMQVFAVGYRLSTERPFPAALDDAVAAYELITQEIRPERLALWGDSAGGGLAAALLLRLRELGIRGPVGAFLFSPWADLRNSAVSFSENEASDERFSLQQATEAAADYLAGHPATDPLVSPALGDWTGQPRLVVQVSDSEVLRDDALLLAQTATDAGVDVRLKVHEGQPHIWNLAYPSTPASESAIDFMIEHLAQLIRPRVCGGTPR